MKLDDIRIAIREDDLNLVLAKLDNIRILLEDKVGQRMIEIKKPTDLGVRQAAEYLGVSRTHFYRIIAAKEIPYRKIRNLKKFSTNDLDDYLKGEYCDKNQSII